MDSSDPSTPSISQSSGRSDCTHSSIDSIPEKGTPDKTEAQIKEMVIDWLERISLEFGEECMEKDKWNEPADWPWRGLDEELRGSLKCRKVTAACMLRVAAERMKDEDWRVRGAAMVGVARVINGVHHSSDSTVCEIAVAGMKDGHERVRNGGFCILFTFGHHLDRMETLAHSEVFNRVISGLITLMEDSSIPRISSRVSFILSYIIATQPKPLSDAFNSVLPSIGRLLEVHTEKVKESWDFIDSLIGVIMAICDEEPSLVHTHYDHLVSLLVRLLKNDASDFTHDFCGEPIPIRALIFYCLDSLARAVDKDRFMPYASEVISSITPLLSSLTPIVRYCKDVLASLMSFAEHLKEDFAPFLPLTVESMLRIVQNDDPPSIDLYETRRDVCEHLGTLADDLRAFTPFAERASTVLSVAIERENGITPPDFIESSSELIDRAVCSFPSLLKSAMPLGEETMGRVWTVQYAALMKEMRGRRDNRIYVAQVFQSIRKSVEILGEKAVSAVQLDEIGEMMKKEWTEEKREHSCTHERFTDIVLDELSSLATTLLNVFGSSSFPLIESLIPLALDVYEEHKCAYWPLFFFSEILEYAPDLASPHFPLVSKLFLTSIHHLDDNCRQTAFYTWGIVAFRRLAQWEALAATAFDGIFKMVTDKDARANEDATEATENGEYALVRIITHWRATIGEERVEKVLHRFLDWLSPTEETEMPYGFFALLIEERNAILFGKDNENKSKIELLLKKIIDSWNIDSTPSSVDLKQRLSMLLSGLMKTDNDELIEKNEKEE